MLHEVVDIDHPDYQPKGGRLAGFYAMLMRKKETRIVRINGKFFKRKRTKLETVQKNERRQPKRQRWMRQARAIYFRHTNLTALWSRTCAALIKAPRK